MAESHVVTGLVAKRAELAGQIEACRRELEHLEADVGHLDGAIKLFAPDYKLENIRAKPPGRRNRFFHQGECQRLVLEIFRDASEPLSAGRLAEALAQRKRLEASPALIEQMRKSALGAVKRLAGKGIIEAAGTDGGGKTWSVC
jgi:hypothetical protein